jgi:hypothetical protein
MRLDLEVRSSGPGPRRPWHGPTGYWFAGWVWTASRVIAERWTRIGPDHKGRTKRLCDGVAVIIRRAK